LFRDRGHELERLSIVQLLNCFRACAADRYVYIGKLLKPGEKATDYTDDEPEETPSPAPAGDKKQD